MYQWQGMKKIDLTQALKIDTNKKSIYLLYPDNTERMINDKDELLKDLEFDTELEIGVEI